MNQVGELKHDHTDIIAISHVSNNHLKSVKVAQGVSLDDVLTLHRLFDTHIL